MRDESTIRIYAMGRRKLTVSDYEAQISTLLSGYENDPDVLRLTRDNDNVSEAVREKAKKDYKRYMRIRQTIRTLNSSLSSNQNNVSSINSRSNISRKYETINSEIIMCYDIRMILLSQIFFCHSIDDTNDTTLNNNRDSTRIVSSGTPNESSDSGLESSSIPNESNDLRRASSRVLHESNDSQRASSTTNDSSALPIISKCFNCHRCQNDEDPLFRLEFSIIRSNEIKLHRTYLFITRTTESQASINHCVCNQCKTYLTHECAKTANSSKNSFAAFLWFMLSSEDVHAVYGGENAWKTIPQPWRQWWINDIRARYPRVYGCVSITHPPSIIEDRTFILNDWKRNITSYLLSNLRDSCNKYLQPLILCPWGCSEFYHRCGVLNFESVYQRYFPKVLLHLKSYDDFDKVVSAREDFFRESHNEYDKLLLNPKWTVKPSVGIIDGTPCFLCCRFHNGGTKKLMVHLCRWEHCLPPPLSDQLCQAVVQPNSLKPMRAATFSHRYQMYQQRFSMKGVESINVSTRCTFGHNSKLLWESEARSVHYRPDILAHMNQLIRDKTLSRDQAEGIRKFSDMYCEKNERKIENFRYGASYVPLEISMCMQRESKDRQIVVTDNAGNETAVFNRVWYSYLYPCQKMDEYGARFYPIPNFSTHNDACLLSKLCSIFLCVEALWTVVATRESYKEGCWYGYLLGFLSKQCIVFNTRRRQKSDVFKISHTGTINEMKSKIPSTNNSFSQLFSDFGTIQCYDLVRFSDQLNIIEKYFEERVDHQWIDIVIFSSIGVSNYIPDFYEVYSDRFELVYISSYFIDQNNRWGFDLYCRHGRHFKKWWYMSRNSGIFLQVDGLPSERREDTTAIYIKTTSPNFEAHKTELLNLLGGQNHVRCQGHRLPLIQSTRKWFCSCNRGRKKEFLRCSIPSCCVGICKLCFESFNRTEVSYVENVSVDPDKDDENNTVLSESDDSSHSSDSSFGFDFYNQQGNEEDDDSVSLGSEGSYNDTYFQTLNNVMNEDEDPFDDGVGVSWTDEADVNTNDIADIFGDGFTFELDDVNIGEIATTNAANEQMEISTETAYGGVNNEFTIGGSGLLMESTSLLSRKKYVVTGSNYDKYFSQRICSTASNTSSPILWPEATMHSGIFYSNANDGYSICGALPGSLMSVSASQEGFCTLPDHIRTRLLVPFSSSSTDPRFISLMFDLMGNMAANFNDTRMFARHGLKAADDSLGGLEQRGKDDTSLNNAVDSRQQVLNLCASLVYVMWDFFLTFTCNQKKHFGTSVIRDWLDSEEWKKHYEGFYSLPTHQQEEIERAMIQSAQGLLLRVWEEVSALFIDLLKRSKNSPFYDAFALFARKEYQQDVGNLSHIHAILKISWEKLSEDEKKFVLELVRASVVDIIRTDELDHFMKEKLIKSYDDVIMIQLDGKRFLSHKCDSRCLVPDKNGVLRCRKKDDHRMSKDCTRDT